MGFLYHIFVGRLLDVRYCFLFKAWRDTRHDKNIKTWPQGCDDSNLCESRKRDVGTLLYLWLVFFDFVKSTENIELPAI